MSRVMRLSLALMLAAAACGSGGLTLSDASFQMVGVVVTATLGPTPDELEGETESEETSTPSPRADDGATPDEPGSADVTVESFSGPLDDCDVDRDRIVEVFFTTSTTFDPADVAEDDAFPTNLDEVRVEIDGRVVVQRESADDDADVVACVLTAEHVRIIGPGESPPPGAPTAEPGPGGPGVTEGPTASPSPTVTPTPTTSPPETSPPVETTEPPETDEPTGSPGS